MQRWRSIMYSHMEKRPTFPGGAAVKCVDFLLMLMELYHILYIINHRQLFLNQPLN